VLYQADTEKQVTKVEKELATVRADQQAAVAALDKCRTDAAATLAALDASERSKASVNGDCERLRVELGLLREELVGTKSSGSSSNEQLRQKSDELMRCEAARATAEALVAELRSSVADAKVRRARQYSFGGASAFMRSFRFFRYCQADTEKQVTKVERELATVRADQQAAVAALDKCRTDAAATSAALDASERASAALTTDCERLRVELTAVREELAGTKSSGSSSNEQLRQKSDELMRCEAARATAEALVAELRSSVADAKVSGPARIDPPLPEG
jgi:chromosome segregation ATPase